MAFFCHSSLCCGYHFFSEPALCVLANHTTASRKHKGKMHEQARPCVFFVSDVCSLRTQNLKLTEEMDHNSKQRKERTTEKYRTNEVQKKHPFLNLQKK